MGKMKKLVAVLLAGGLMASMSLTAFAASGISANEQKILDKANGVKSHYTMSASQEKKYNDAIAQATSYLEKNDLTEAQVNSITGAIDNAAAAVSAACEGGSDLSKLTSDELKALSTRVVSALQAGADAAGIKITIGADGTATVTDAKTGDTVAKTDSTVKATGVAVNTTAAVIATLVVALAGCAIFAKKKRLFA